MSEVFSLAADREVALGRAAGALRAGLLAVVPTDTVYGLAADAFNRGATTNVFIAKRRPRALPLPVLVSRPRQAWALSAAAPQGAAELVAAFWPGALTLVLPETELDWDLGDTGGGIAVRMPDHPALIELLETVGPLAVTSANLSGLATARTVDEVRAQLGESVAVYVDGGPSGSDVASTIVDMRFTPPRIVREGAIPAEAIERALGANVAR